MNEQDCRDILLVRAFETVPNASWNAEDRQRASDAAAREAGSEASGEKFLATRARLAAAWLRERDPTARWLDRASRWPRGAGALIALVGLLVGFAGDAASAGGIINVLAPPLFALLAWNLAVYAGLAVARLRGHRSAGSPLRRAWARLLASRLRRRGGSTPALSARFARDWALAAGPLSGARLATALHAAAACLAVGAIAGLYLRGLVFEYRAGWESTFLDAGQVAKLLRFTFGPASLVSGIELPDAARLAAMRLPETTGERAATWIHLQTVTLAMIVLLPRLLLAFEAGLRAHRLAGAMRLPDADPYLAALLRGRRNEAAVVQIVPYSAGLGDSARDSLATLLAQAFGPSVQVRIAPNVAFGDETVPTLAGACASPDWSAILFRLAATPEREVHLQFADAVRAALAPAVPLAVMIDDASFRARFPDPERIAQRVEAWRRVFEGRDYPLVFVTLSPDGIETSLHELLGMLGTVPATSD